MSENPIRRQLLLEILGPHDPLERIQRLHDLGLSQRIIATLTGWPQSHIARVLDDSVYAAHLRYNAAWKRAKRRKGV